VDWTLQRKPSSLPLGEREREPWVGEENKKLEGIEREKAVAEDTSKKAIAVA